MKILNQNGLRYSIRVLFVWENRDSKTCENQVESVNKHTRSIFFLAQYPKDTAKAPTVEIKAEHPKRYQNRSPLFLYGSPPPPGRGGGLVRPSRSVFL